MVEDGTFKTFKTLNYKKDHLIALNDKEGDGSNESSEHLHPAERIIIIIITFLMRP